MEKEKDLRAQDDREQRPSEKETWREPELEFVEPKLTKEGSLKEVTGQFFGPFSP